MQLNGSSSSRRPLPAVAAAGSGRGGWTPLRVLILLNVAILGLFYLAVTQFHFRMNTMDGGGTGRDLVHPSAVRGMKDVSPAALAQVMALALTPPVPPPGWHKLWDGPLDLDEESQRRGRQITQEWVNKPDPHNWWERPGYHLSYMEEWPPYPFQRIRDEAGKDTGIVALIAPFYNTVYYKAEAAKALFWRLKANGHVLIGISSYQEFPRQTSNPYDDRHTIPEDWEVYKAMDGWLHCFRQPDAWLPEGVPRILLSESDFHNPDRHDAGGSLVPSGKEKQYDVFYNNLGGQWNDYARNWTLAKGCIIAAAHELNTTFLILGRDLTQEAELQPLIASGNVISHPKAQWKEVLDLIDASRSLMAPNVFDASPRIAVEALCKDIPILMNRHILGGWKYVQEETGEFFETPEEFVAGLRRLKDPERAAKLAPRKWYKETWGYDNAITQFQAFMQMVVGDERLATARQVVVDHKAENRRRRRGLLSLPALPAVLGDEAISGFGGAEEDSELAR